MKRIKNRRRVLRIHNPIGFSLLCCACILVLALIGVGIWALVVYGPDMARCVKSEIAGAADATAAPTYTPEPTATSTASTDPNAAETPNATTPAEATETATPEAAATESPVIQTADPNAPLYGYTIGLDPTRDGDSKYDAECAYNLQLAQELQAYLESKGATVIVTRDDNDSSVSNDKRADIIDEASCNIALRLMCNHISSSSSGCYVQTSSRYESMGKAFIDTYSDMTGIKKQAGKSSGWEKKSDAVGKQTHCPTIMLILGNWDNKSERANMQDDAFRRTMIEAIYQGLLDALTQ